MGSVSQRVPAPKCVGSGLSSARARTFALTWLAYAGFYLCRKNLSVLMPFLQNESGIPKLRLADILFAYSLCYSAGQFLMGSLADRFSPRAVVAAGMGTAGVANIVMFADHRYGVLLTMGMVNGLAQSAGWPGLLKMMSLWFRREERGVIMGWWTTNYVLGSFLATLFAAWAVSVGHWAGGFILPAGLLLVVAVIFLSQVRDRPAAAVEPEAKEERRHALAGYRDVVVRPVAWATGAAAFLVKITRYSFLFWLPLYLTEHLGYRPDRAGYLSSVYELAGIGGALAAGYLSDRHFGSRRYPVVSLALAGLAFVCLLQPAFARLGWPGIVVCIGLIGTTTFGADTTLQGSASQDAGGPGSAASAAGLINGIASAGQLISPYLVAEVATRWGWDTLFTLFVAIALGGSALAALFWNHKPGRIG